MLSPVSTDDDFLDKNGAEESVCNISAPASELVLELSKSTIIFALKTCYIGLQITITKYNILYPGLTSRTRIGT